jgi:hypothetical protein
MEIKKIQISGINKRGQFDMSQVFGAVLAVVLIAVLLIVAISIFSSLSEQFEYDSQSSNATNDIIAEFGELPALLGLVGTIVFLGLVIGIVFASFVFGGRSPEYEDEDEEDDEDDDDWDDDEEEEDDWDEDEEDDIPIATQQPEYVEKEEAIVKTTIINTKEDSEDRVVHKKW